MLETSQLYQRWTRALIQVDADPGILQSFMRLRATVSEQSKVIVHFFPQYTPHDATRHLEQLFALADRVLGTALYDKLNASELSVLTFALYCHDWGMALSHEERAAISGLQAAPPDLRLLPNEAPTFEAFRADAIRMGKSDIQLWEEYTRLTHGQRSGYRLRSELLTLSSSFAEMVARAAEGHALDIREIRDPDLYPVSGALFGQVTNVAAVTTYVRLIDLLDIAEDRTPFALWSMVRPHDLVSHWSGKSIVLWHRLLSTATETSEGY